MMVPRLAVCAAVRVPIWLPLGTAVDDRGSSGTMTERLVVSVAPGPWMWKPEIRSPLMF